MSRHFLAHNHEPRSQLGMVWKDWSMKNSQHCNFLNEVLRHSSRKAHSGLRPHVCCLETDSKAMSRRRSFHLDEAEGEGASLANLKTECAEIDRPLWRIAYSMQIAERSLSVTRKCVPPPDRLWIFEAKHRCFAHAEKVLDHHSSISVTVTLVRGKRIERPL